MSEYKTIMDNYVKYGSTDDMIRVSEVINHLFCHLRESDPELYNKYITKMKLANRHMGWDKSQAECAVRKMKNKDGTEGPHWTYDQTTDVLHSKGLEFEEAEWHYVLNLVYSDHYCEKFDTDTYIRLAKDVVSDMDVLPNSTKRTYIAKHYD